MDEQEKKRDKQFCLVYWEVVHCYLLAIGGVTEYQIRQYVFKQDKSRWNDLQAQMMIYSAIKVENTQF